MDKFEIGDKVRVIRDYNIYITTGITGVVIGQSGSGKSLGIEFSTYMPFANNLNGLCKDGHGYYVKPEFLEKIDDNKSNTSSRKKNDFLPSDVEDVIIHNDTVIVTLTDGRKGISKKLDSDTFDAYCGFTNAYYRAKNEHIFDLKTVLNNCIKSAEKKGYKQAILKNY